MRPEPFQRRKLLQQDLAWQQDAACLGYSYRDDFDPENDPWFPGRGGGVQIPKAYCNGCDEETGHKLGLGGARKPCPARDQCLAWALSLPPDRDDGVLGGMTADKRRQLRKELSRRNLRTNESGVA